MLVKCFGEQIAKRKITIPMFCLRIAMPAYSGAVGGVPLALALPMVHSFSISHLLRVKEERDAKERARASQKSPEDARRKSRTRSPRAG